MNENINFILMNQLQKIQEASRFIKSQTEYQPSIGLILGSGLGDWANQIENPTVITYDKIPHFPVSTVSGHKGQFVIGSIQGKTVIAMQGRPHYYEGYSMEQITFPTRVMNDLGIELLIVTNACGAINPNFYPGALMFISDHINFMGTNPLIGENFEELGARFPDMSNIYDKDLIKMGQSLADKLEIETFTGIYTAVSGPYYFSKAELAMIRGFGSDTIGMSTIPEAIVATHSGLKVLGISCVTDMAIPEDLEPLHHDRVVEVANKLKPKFISLVNEIVKEV